MRYSYSKILIGLIGISAALAGIFISGIWFSSEQESYIQEFVNCKQIIQRLQVIESEIECSKAIRSSGNQYDNISAHRQYEKHRSRTILLCNELRKLYGEKEQDNFPLDELVGNAVLFFDRMMTHHEENPDDGSIGWDGNDPVTSAANIENKITGYITSEIVRQDQLIIDAGQKMEEYRLIAVFMYVISSLVGLGSIIIVFTQVKKIIREFNFSDESLNYKLKDYELNLTHLKCISLVDKVSILDKEAQGELFKSLLVILPSLLRFPSDACAILSLNGKDFYSPNYRDPEWKLSSPVKVFGEEAGSIELGYIQLQPESDSGLFTIEEKEFLDEIADRLGVALGISGEYSSLKENNSLLTALAETVSSGIIVLDADLRILTVNSAAEKLLEIQKDEIKNLYFSELKLIEENTEISEKISNGENFTNEIVRLETVYGTKTVLLSLKEIERPVSSLHYAVTIMVVPKVSQSSHTVSSLQKNSIRKFIRIMHTLLDELAETLTTISGTASAVVKSSLTGEKDLGGVRDIYSQTLYSSDILRNVLAVLENIDSKPRTVNLAEIVLRYSPMLERVSRDKLNLKFKINNELWDVELDPQAFCFALVSLLIYISKRIEGKSNLTISFDNLTNTENSDILIENIPLGDYVKMSLLIPDKNVFMSDLVRKTGIGGKYPPSDSEPVFKLMREVIDQVQGYSFIESKDGNITSLNILLPATETQGIEISTENSRLNLDTYGVLIAGTNPDFLKDLAGLFSIKGARVYIAETGKEAYFILKSRRESIKIIIADAVMPEMNGFQLIRYSKKLSPETINILLVDYKIHLEDYNEKEKLDYTLLASDSGTADIFNKITSIISSNISFTR